MFGLRGVILAGGASQRMGRDKAATDHNGTIFLTLVTSLLEAVGATSTALLGRSDLPNSVPDRLPLYGLAAALVDYLSTMPGGSRHLVLPAGMPGVSIYALSRLTAQQDWAYFDGHMLPTLAVGSSWFMMPATRLRDPLNLKKARCLPMLQANRDWLVNLNTPEDLRLWRQHTPQYGVREYV